MRIGVDLMGSDNSPNLLFKAVVEASQQLEGSYFTVFATQSIIDSIRESYSEVFPHPKIEFFASIDVIEMGDDPLIAIRQKKNSSLVMGIRLLKKKYLDAFVSAGNTGALIASSTLSLPLLTGIKRPALLATLPTEKGYVAVIDVGGNVASKAEHLLQFAQMGSAYQTCSQGIQIPKIGLLNIGVESKKGTSEVRRAYDLMSQKGSEASKMNFIGNIEGREVFQGKVDVLVTDGFTGNVLLKSSEGASYFILEHLKFALNELPQEQKENILKYLKYHFDFEEYSGALLCGVERVVVKCHGKSSPKGLLNGIIGAADLVKNGFIEQMKKLLSS